MAGKKREKVRDEDVTGLNIISILQDPPAAAQAGEPASWTTRFADFWLRILALHRDVPPRCRLLGEYGRLLGSFQGSLERL